jgi:hypothetical protein
LVRHFKMCEGMRFAIVSNEEGLKSYKSFFDHKTPIAENKKDQC